MCYKTILFIFLIALTGCNATRSTQVVSETTQMKSLTEMVNESIVQDVYDGDTLGKKVFILK
jgi:hypothetical protein